MDLYKYRSFSSYEDEKRVKDIILDSSLWFARGDEVNDPFEFRFNYEVDSDEQRNLFAVHAQAAEPRLTAAEAREKVNRVLAGVSEDKKKVRCWDAQIELWRGIASNTLMCCFAGTGKSILMWSHYADYHRGVCLELSLGIAEQHLWKVTYDDRLTKFSIMDMLGNRDSAFARKSKCWEYEEEYRLMYPGTVARAQTMPPGLVRRVIVGMAMPASKRDALFSWIARNAPGVKVAIAGPASDKSHGIEFEDVTP